MKRSGYACGWIALVVVVMVALVHAYSAKNTAPLVDAQPADHETSGYPQRIISLTPANTEILFALGAGQRVVGVTDYSNYPPEAREKTTVGNYFSPDIEKIVALNPDLVFASRDIHPVYMQILQRAGIRSVGIDPVTMDGVLQAIVDISVAIGEPDRGQKLVSDLVAKRNSVRAAVHGSPMQTVFLEVWDRPLLTVGAKSYINDLLSEAGGMNVASGVKRDYWSCDLEQLMGYDPDAYVVLSHGETLVRLDVTAKPELQDLRAIRNHRVYRMDEDIIFRPGPRSFDGLVTMAHLLHDGQ